MGRFTQIYTHTLLMHKEILNIYSRLYMVYVTAIPGSRTEGEYNLGYLCSYIFHRNGIFGTTVSTLSESSGMN